MILLAGVLFASLLGSVHCGAMCSVFACMANGTSRRGAWYHGGRLSRLRDARRVAGALGAALDSAGLIAHVQRSAALVAGAALVVWGAVQLRQAVRARRFGGATQWGGALGRLLCTHRSVGSARASDGDRSDHGAVALRLAVGVHRDRHGHRLATHSDAGDGGVLDRHPPDAADRDGRRPTLRTDGHRSLATRERVDSSLHSASESSRHTCSCQR